MKRAHSADPESASVSSRKSPSAGPFAGDVTPPDSSAPGGPLSSSSSAFPGSLSAGAASLFGKSSLPADDSAVVGSPMKKARPSIAGLDDPPNSVFPVGTAGLGDVLAKAEAAEAARRKLGAALAAAVKGEGGGAEGKGKDKLDGDAMEEEEEL